MARGGKKAKLEVAYSLRQLLKNKHIGIKETLTAPGLTPGKGDRPIGHSLAYRTDAPGNYYRDVFPELVTSPLGFTGQVITTILPSISILYSFSFHLKNGVAL